MQVSRSILGAISFCIFLRLVVAACIHWMGSPAQAFCLTDTESYLAPARALATSGAFLNNQGQADFFRTPGYPLSLVPGIVLGFPMLGGVVTQVVFSGLVVLLTGIWGKELWGDIVGTRAAWIMAFDPLSLVMSMVLMSDMLFSLLVLLGAWLLWRSRQEDLLQLAMSGLCLGFASLVKPVGLYLAPCLLIAWLVQIHGRSYRMLSLFGVSAIFFFCSFLLPMGWIARNIENGYFGFSSSSQVLADCYVKPAIIAQATHQDYYALRSSLGCVESLLPKQELPGLLTVASEYPWVTFKVFVQGLVRGMLDPGTLDLARMLGLYPAQGGLMGVATSQGILVALKALIVRNPGVVLLLGISFPWVLVLMLLGIVGMIRKSYTSWSEWLIPLTLTGYFLFFCAGPGSVGRYRLPLMPVLAWLAAHGLVHLKGRRGVA